MNKTFNFNFPRLGGDSNSDQSYDIMCYEAKIQGCEEIGRMIGCDISAACSSIIRENSSGKTFSLNSAEHLECIETSHDQIVSITTDAINVFLQKVVCENADPHIKSISFSNVQQVLSNIKDIDDLNGMAELFSEHPITNDMVEVLRLLLGFKEAYESGIEQILSEWDIHIGNRG